MNFGSVCSGIEAASVAWHPLGWRAAWLSEIESFPCGVLAHHYPDVPNLGDMTTLTGRIASGEVEAPDVFTGGTPCQAFSVAGKRGSLADARGNLSLTFCEIADAIDDVRAAAGREPSVIVWENVPGVLSTTDNAFGCFLGALAGAGCELQPAGGRWTNAGVVLGPRRAVAWRVLDAQYFGLAQRRKRVFVVASARDGFDPAAVLFEFDGLRRDSAPSRKAGEAAPTSIDERAASRGWPVDVAPTLNAAFGDKQGLEDQHALNGAGLFVPAIVGTLTARSVTSLGAPEVDGGMFLPCVGALTSSMGSSYLGHNTDEHVIAIRTAQTGSNGWGVNTDGTAYTLDSAQQAVAFREVAGTITSNYGKQPDSSDTSLGPNLAWQGMAVRRLTTIECERLQGFPDDYTRIPWRGKPADQCPDGPRYKALGNSMAVPCMRWIGERIAAVDAINAIREAA